MLPKGVTIDDGILRIDKTLEKVEKLAEYKNDVKIVIIEGNAVIGDRVFLEFKFLEKVTADDITIVGDMAFYGCIKLTDVSMKFCKSIGVSAFAETSIEIANFPFAERVSDHAFAECNSLITVFLPRASLGKSVLGSHNSNSKLQKFVTKKLRKSEQIMEK
jgi:hypothetical protein